VDAGSPVARRLRCAAGVLLALLAVCLALPEWLKPLARALDLATGGAMDAATGLATARGALARLAALQPWPVVPAAISLVLLLAVWVIPTPRTLPAPPRRPRTVLRDETAIAVGILLLAEPLMHLGFLAWSGWMPSAVSRDAVLAVPMLGPGASAPWWSGILTILTLSVLVPVAEESFFRWRLLDLLRAWLGGTRRATIAAATLTTLAFAAAHGTQVQALFAVPLGLLLVFIRLRGGGLGGCILAHACHNSLFLFIGPLLFALPWAAPLLGLAGAMLIAAAWIHHSSPQPRVPGRWRPTVAVAAVVLTAVVVLGTYPRYRILQDHLWAAAAHRVITHWRVDNDVLVRRLDYQERRRRLTPARRGGLYDLLLAQPCQPLPGGNPRQAIVLAQLDPQRFADQVPDAGIYDALLDLGECRATWDHLGVAARRLALRQPGKLAAIATVNPEALVQWLPLPERSDECLAQLRATGGHQRRMLLAGLERAHPGRVADVLLRLPPAEVTPLDRRHLFQHYPDARTRLAELARQDPQRAQAFIGPE
jgi:membrane protease YdiL (CAAX protease family)